MSPGFTESEIFTLREILTQRYQKDIEIHLTDGEIALFPGLEEPEPCPTIFWHARETNFVVIKTGKFTYRAKYFYTPQDQYGTGIDEYSDLEKCVMAVLQSQSEHERERPGISPGGNGEIRSQEQ